ncbi:MAG: hypothetical protein KAX16_04355 [Actinomycetia bacterium]|nr:hypothetical protein [Actinomycetes bacterium]
MRRNKFFWSIVFGVGLYLFWSLAVLPISADHTPVCGACHAPSAPYKTTGSSQHKDIGCLACHRDPGVGGLLTADIRGFRNLKSILFKNPAQEKFVANDACLSCHDKILDGIVKTKSIKMSHREVIDAGWRCGECHGVTGHKLSGLKTKIKSASMDKCFGCHLRKAALRECDVCHVGEIKKNGLKDPKAMGQLAHVENWTRGDHAFANNRQCPVCHKPDFCEACHEISLPHSKANWPYNHGSAAAFNPGNCNTCHKPEFCLNCHGVTMPHPPDFEKEHLAVINQETCFTCHFRTQCERCHATHKRHRR